MGKQNKNHTWKFQRAGGREQVVLQTTSDIIQLPTLDPKLWVALSCPTSSLDFDATILMLLDHDNDQRIRMPDIIEAVTWLGRRLKQLDGLIQGRNGLFLADINPHTQEGKKIATTIKTLLTHVGKKESDIIVEADLTLALKTITNTRFNGEGILSTTSPLDDAMIHFIQDALNVMGGVQNSQGDVGINSDIAQAFIDSLNDWRQWRQQLNSIAVPFKAPLSEVWQLFINLKDKIDDYFLRSQLASYAPQAEVRLNVNEHYIVPTDNQLLDQHALAALPLSRVVANKPLDLNAAINPAWKMDMQRFSTLIKPFLSHAGQLRDEEWWQIKAWLNPYTEAAKSKPKPVPVDVTIQPTSTIDALGEKRVATILKSNIAHQFAQQVQADRQAPALSTELTELRRLLVYHQYLYRLLLNFVSFDDFFDPQRNAIFQSGQLYIDGRCCTLCLPVNDITQHIALASYSELFLLYCRCIRKRPTGNDTQDKTEIVAAVTAGDADFLLKGRNGVFIDNKGQDWDATVINVIVKPISIPQAIWRPYKQCIRFISAQINKLAAAKEQTLLTPTSATPAATATKFDLSKNMGIFAAIGLAIGAIGTALATILHALLQLVWWQIPLVFLAIFLLISGLSVLLAALKLSQRTLAPLLEASGWAINGRIRINFPVGTLLTTKATLPNNARLRRLNGINSSYWVIWFVLSLLIITILIGTMVWYHRSHSAGQLRKNFETIIRPVPTKSEPAPTVDPPTAQPTVPIIMKKTD